MVPSPKQSQLGRNHAIGRDVRVDFFRGLALIIIFIDHVPNNYFEQFTLHNFGFADAADIFVGLAGYASFLAYTKAVDDRGWGVGILKVVRRIRDLYLAHIAVMFVCVGVLIFASEWFGKISYENILDFSPFLDDTDDAFRKALALVHQPALLNILPLYVVLLAWFPILLWLVRTSVALALLVSFGLWLGANLLDWNLPTYPEGEGWFFNPFAWQLLFSLGVITAHAATNRDWPAHSRWLLGLSVAYVLFAVAVAAPWRNIPAYEDARLVSADWLVSDESKQYLALWRVAHFAALAYIAAYVIPVRAAWLETAPAQWIAVCGRHSLPVFCLGIVLAIAGAIAMAEFGPGWVTQIGINSIGIALLVIAAQIMSAWSADSRAAPAAAESGRGTPALSLGDRST